MATWRITAPRNMGAHKKGDTYTVITRTTGSPAVTDMEEVLYIHGHRGYDGLSWRASGNWTCTKLDDSTSGWEEQHQKYLAAKAAEEGKKKQATGGAQGGAQGGAPAKPLTFSQKLTRVAVAVVANGAMEASSQKKPSALTRTKRALPKPKPTRVATASTSVAGAATTGVKKSLLSTTKVASIAKARPTAAASRGNVLGMVKSSGSKAKGSSIFGKSKPLSKKGGIAGGGIKKAGGSTLGGGIKKSGGALGGGAKKSGGMLGGGAKKSGGMLGGGAKKSSGMLGGGAKKSSGMLGGGAKKLGGGMLGGKKRR